MSILLREPDKKINLTKEELGYFLAYLEKCKCHGFSGSHFFKHALCRENLLKFALTTFCEKCLTKFFNNNHVLPSKKINLTVNYAEEQALIAMFQRIDGGPYILALQQKILRFLRPIREPNHILPFTA